MREVLKVYKITKKSDKRTAEPASRSIRKRPRVSIASAMGPANGTDEELTFEGSGGIEAITQNVPTVFGYRMVHEDGLDLGVTQGIRPYALCHFYKEKNVGRVGVDLCAKAVEAAWKDPEFIAEQRRICGDNKEYVFPYKRKSGTVKGHCRNLHAPRPRARKPKADPRIKQLERLIQKRANTNDMRENARLSADIRALRAELKRAIGRRCGTRNGTQRGAVSFKATLAT